MAEYDETRELMSDLWPNAESNIAVKSLFRERLSALNQEWLKSAVKNVRVHYSSKTPELKWIIAEYGKIKDNFRKSSESAGPSNEAKEEDEEYNRQVESDDAHALFELELMTDDQIREALDCLGKTNPWARGLCGRAAGRPSQWTRLARGVLWAFLNLPSDQSQSHNQDQRPPELATG